MTSVAAADIASTPKSTTKRKRDENDPLEDGSKIDGIALGQSRIPRMSVAPTPNAAKKGRVSVVGAAESSLRTPLANKTNVLHAAHKDLKTPQTKPGAAASLKTPQTRIAKPPSSTVASAVSARTGIKAPGAVKPRPSLRPVPKPDLTAQTPQTKGGAAAAREDGSIVNRENLSAPGSVSGLIEQAGFEERVRVLEEEFARKNKEAEELWNKKAEELQKQMELAKEQHDGAVKAQFEMASLLTSQREKYEETINKLCDELAEAKAKLAQLMNEQKSSTAVAVAEAEQKLKLELEQAYMATLKGLEESLNEVQESMEAQLYECKRNEAAAIAAQDALKAQISELQARHDGHQKAQADAAAASDLQAQQHSEEWTQKLTQLEEEWRSKLMELQRELDEIREKETTTSTHNHELEALLASHSVQIGSYNLEKETILKERALIEEELARAREEFVTKSQDQEAQWSERLLECTKQLEELKQQEQEARSAQREVTLLLSTQEEKYESTILRIQEELAQTQAKLRLQEEEHQKQVKEHMELESTLQDMRNMQADAQRKLEEQEKEWAAKVEGLREQMDIEKQQSLADQAQQHAVALQEKEAMWTVKFEDLRQELETARQAEQDAFNTQREIATLLSNAQEKHDQEVQQLGQEWSAKCDELQRQLEVARHAESTLISEEKANYEDRIKTVQCEIAELRKELAAEREQRRLQIETAQRTEANFHGWLADTKGVLMRGLACHPHDRVHL